MENKIISIQNVKGYLEDSNKIAYLNTEDVARGLGFTQIKNGIEYIRWETIRNYLKEFSFPTSWENEKVPEYIPENIFYKLCFKAKNETARKFQDFVTDEVLPNIRKTGMYATDELLDNPDLAIKALQRLKEEREQRKLLEEKIEEQKPKVLFANSVQSSENCITVNEMAKLLRQNGIDIGESRLFIWLRQNGYLSKEKADWNIPTQKSMDLGLFKLKKSTYKDGNRTFVNKKSLVTGKGQIYFINKFKGLMKDT